MSKEDAIWWWSNLPEGLMEAWIETIYEIHKKKEKNAKKNK